MTVAVAHIMNTHVYFASLDDTVDHVRELMAAKRVHAIPIVGEERKVLGIVTTADLARRLEDEAPIQHVISEMVTTIDATASVGQAARLMRERRIHHLVVADQGKAVGIVSCYDLLSLFELIHDDAKEDGEPAAKAADSAGDAGAEAEAS